MTLRIEVDGVTYENWVSAELERSLDVLAHRFSFAYVMEYGAPLQAINAGVRLEDFNRPIYIGALVALYWDDELLTVGWVDSLTQQITGTERTWTVEGRSLTGDLCDCSATHETGTWRNRTALQIARDLCTPFDIEVVSSEPDDEQFDRFAIEEGETVADALDRLVKVRGLRLLTRASGGLELMRITSFVSRGLHPNDTVTDRTFEQNISNRFSHYLLHATDVDSAAQVEDTAIGRYRPLVVVGDSRATGAQAKTRAKWEKAVRAGRSERVRLSMPSATAPEGKTYFPARSVSLVDLDLEIFGPLICARSVLRVTSKDVMTEIELCRPEAYSLRDYPTTLLNGVTARGKAKRHKTKPGAK